MMTEKQQHGFFLNEIQPYVDIKVKEAKQKVREAIEKICYCSTSNIKERQCNDKDCIGCGYNKRLKKELKIWM